MYADFHFYYHLDVVVMLGAGVPPARFLALIARLPEGSMTRSMQQGEDDWQQFLGFDQDSYALAGIYNAVNTNTAATGWFSKRPKFDPWPTPLVVVEAREAKVSSVRGLWAALGGASSE